MRKLICAVALSALIPMAYADDAEMAPAVSTEANATVDQAAPVATTPAKKKMKRHHRMKAKAKVNADAPAATDAPAASEAAAPTADTQ